MGGNSRLIRKVLSPVRSHLAAGLLPGTVGRGEVAFVGGETRTGDHAAAAAKRGETSAGVGEKALEEDEGTAACDGVGTSTKITESPVAQSWVGAVPRGAPGDLSISVASNTSHKKQED